MLASLCLVAFLLAILGDLQQGDEALLKATEVLRAQEQQSMQQAPVDAHCPADVTSGVGPSRGTSGCRASGARRRAVARLVGAEPSPSAGASLVGHEGVDLNMVNTGGQRMPKLHLTTLPKAIKSS